MAWIGLGAAVLLTAAVLQFFRPATAIARGQALVAGRLNELLPSSLPGGWSGKELPLGESELLRQRTEGLLQFDDYVYREFSRNGITFAVYAAHWQPGKMPTRLVSLHTPDRCWVENGWICEASRNREPLFAAQGLPATEWRIFSSPGGRGKIYTAFWLLRDGRIYDFGEGLNTIPSPIKWWRGVLEESRGGMPEHLFVRITSDRPFELLAKDPVWAELAAALRRLGLQERMEVPAS